MLAVTDGLFVSPIGIVPYLSLLVLLELFVLSHGRNEGTAVSMKIGLLVAKWLAS